MRAYMSLHDMRGRGYDCLGQHRGAGPVHLEVTSAPRLEDREIVVAGLAAFDRARVGIEMQPLAILARDDGSVIVAGLVGRTVASWLIIEMLWVSEAHRGAGLGTRMTGCAEAEAKQRGCVGATVNTGSFQAPGFYQKLGYTVFGVLEDCPPGHQPLSLCKRLDEETAVSFAASG